MESPSYGRITEVGSIFWYSPPLPSLPPSPPSPLLPSPSLPSSPLLSPSTPSPLLPLLPLLHSPPLSSPPLSLSLPFPPLHSSPLPLYGCPMKYTWAVYQIQVQSQTYSAYTLTPASPSSWLKIIKNSSKNINAQSASLRSLVAAEITLLAQKYCVSWEVFETLVQRCCVSWEVFETLVQRCCVIWEKCSSTIFFAPPPSPPLQIKLGRPIAVNCSGIFWGSCNHYSLFSIEGQSTIQCQQHEVTIDQMFLLANFICSIRGCTIPKFAQNTYIEST